MWSVASFSYYLLIYMNKYFEGSIYVNFYLDGISGLIGSCTAVLIYTCARIRWSFIIASTLSLLGSVFLLLFQQDYISPNFVSVFMTEKSPYDEDSPETKAYYLAVLIPAVVFVTKIGVNITWYVVYQASFSENIVFPFYNRATAIGICNFIARLSITLSSIVAELPRPVPASVLITLFAIELIVCFFLPSIKEQEEFDERDKKRPTLQKDE